MILGTLQQLYSAPTSAKTESKSGQVLPLENKSESVVAHLTESESLADITRGRDVRNMTHADMADMSLALYQNNRISFDDHAMLSLQTNKILQDLEGSQADTPKDFIQYWQDKKQFHLEQGETQFAEKDQRVLNILGNIEALAQQGATRKTV